MGISEKESIFQNARRDGLTERQSRELSETLMTMREDFEMDAGQRG